MQAGKAVQTPCAFPESDLIQRLSRGFLFNLLAHYLDGGIFPVFTMVWKFVQIPQCCREIRAVRVSRGETLVFYFAESFGYPRPRDAHAAHISVPVYCLRSERYPNVISRIGR